MPDREQFADLIFPLHGISLLQGFGMQTPGTTPVGLNVRTFEVLTQRGRGGSRPGLAKYIPAQLPNGPHKIQMLNVVVDPQGGALGDIDDGDFPDPSDVGPRRLWGIYFTRSPARRIRRGGHGYQTWKNKPPRLRLIITADDQTKTAGQTITFPANGMGFYTQMGLDVLETIVSVTITSPGAGAGAVNGTYPIIPSHAIITGSQPNRYDIQYVNGTMVVGPRMGQAYQALDQIGWNFVALTAPASLDSVDIDNPPNTFRFWLDNGFIRSIGSVDTTGRPDIYYY